MKIFQMNDCDWMAGETAEECLAEYLSMDYATYSDREEPDDPRELTDEQLDKLRFCDTDVEPNARRTFREQLQHMVDSGHKFPTFFASTEF